MSFWREESARIIAAVLEETAGQGEAAVKRRLRDAYPFGERQYHPYKIWLSEIARQRGIVKMTALHKRQLAEIKALHTSLFGEQN